MQPAGGLTELVATIENLSEAGSYDQLLAHLQTQEEMLIQHLPQLDDVLPVLRPVQHSLGMIFILCARPPPFACCQPADHTKQPVTFTSPTASRQPCRSTRILPSHMPAGSARLQLCP
jgi:hypothetical protein